MTFSLKREWLWLWLVPMILLASSSLVGARGRLAAEFTGQFLLLAAVSSVVVSPRTLRAVLGVLLGAAAVLAVGAFLLSATVWQDAQHLSLSGLRAALGHNAVLGNNTVLGNTVTTSAGRRWYVPGDAEPASLSFEARLATGSLGWDWRRSTAALELSPHNEAGEAFTRVRNPTRGDPYLMRTFDLKSSAGSRTFRVEGQMRGSEYVPAQGCRGVWLQTWGAGGSQACQAVSLGPTWRTFTLEWTAPEASEASVVRVVLNDFEGITYDVRDVKVYELIDDERIRLEPANQEAVTLVTRWGLGDEQVQLSRTFTPTDAWQTFTFTLEDLPGKTLLHALLSVGSGQTQETAVQLRNTDVTTASSAVSVPIVTRSQLWFAHPNLAAHTLLSLGLVTLATTASLGLTLLVAALAAVTVILTQSRAALLALALGSTLFFALALPAGRFRTERLRRTALVAGALIVLGLGAFALLGLADSFTDRPGISRLDIWQVSAQAFLGNPWQGIGDTFASFWLESYAGQSTEPILHAHNLWLHLAASYGLLGLLASLWLTGGLLLLAWRWGRVRGLALVVPVLLMNVFDYTFFYSGVLFPLILGLNALRQPQGRLRTQPDSDTSYTEPS